MKRRVVRLLVGSADRTAVRLPEWCPGPVNVADCRIAVVPLQRIVIVVLTESARQLPLRGDVPVDLREHGRVAVHALLVGEPDGIVAQARN